MHPRLEIGLSEWQTQTMANIYLIYLALSMQVVLSEKKLFEKYDNQFKRLLFYLCYDDECFSSNRKVGGMPYISTFIQHKK